MNQVEVKRRQIEAFSYIIGLINLIIFGKILGDNGIAYLVIALEGFSFLWTLTAGSLSDALGKMLRARKVKGQFKNAMHIRKRVMILQGILGLLFSVLFAVCSGLIGQYVFQVPYSSLIMAVLAPALLFRTLSAVFAGYFQGEGTELPTAVSLILRQVFLMGFGLLFINLLGGYGRKVSMLLGEEAYTAMYGGVGAAIGIVLSELLVLLFLGLIFWGNRRAMSRQDGEGMKRTESFADTVRVLYGTMGMSVLLQLLGCLPLWLGAVFYRKSVVDTGTFAESYGGYAGKYLVVCGLVILLVYASLIASNAKTMGHLRREEQKYAKNIFHGGLQIGLSMSLFFAAFLAVMAQQLSGIFYDTAPKQLTEMFRGGSAWIVFSVLGLYFSGLLLLAGKKMHLAGCLGIADILFVILGSVFLNAGKMGIMSLVYASLISAGILCLILGFLCCRFLRMGIEWLRVIVIPAGAACVVGLLCLFLGKVLTPHLGNAVALIVCLIPAFFIFWVILLLFRCFREQELKHIPGGGLLRSVGQMMHVF